MKIKDLKVGGKFNDLRILSITNCACGRTRTIETRHITYEYLPASAKIRVKPPFGSLGSSVNSLLNEITLQLYKGMDVCSVAIHRFGYQNGFPCPIEVLEPYDKDWA